MQELSDGLLKMTYFEMRLIEAVKKGHTIPEEFADAKIAPLRVCRAFNQPDSFKTTAAKDFKASILKTFPEEDMLKEQMRDSWNPIFYAAVKSTVKPGRDSGSTCYIL